MPITASPLVTAPVADRRPPTAPHHRDGGQATPFVVLLVVLALGAVVLLGRLGGVVVDRAEARTAADAAATAAALDRSDDAARAAAVANDGEVEDITWFGSEVEVTVRVGGARATSRARPGG